MSEEMQRLTAERERLRAFVMMLVEAYVCEQEPACGDVQECVPCGAAAALEGP